MKKLLKFYLASALVISGFAFAPLAKAESEDNTSTESITPYPYPYPYPENQLVDEIESTDDLAAYDLTTNAQGEIVSIPNKTRAINYTYPNGIQARIGDILVSDTKVGGGTNYVGHVAIVTSTNTVTMSGADYGPNLQSLDSWFKRTNVYVVRITNSEIVTNAASWASMKYNGGAVFKYGFGGSVNDLSPNYCSKFVYQAYNKGNNKVILGFFPGGEVGLITPFDFINERFYPNTDEKIIVKKGTL